MFVTPDGIHVGSTLDDLETAYGTRLIVGTATECGERGSFFVGGPDATVIYGRLSGPPYQGDSIVVSLGGGVRSSC